MFIPAWRGHAPRVWFAAAFAFFAGIGTVASLSAFIPSVSVAQSADDLGADGLAANTAWWTALVAGTPEAVGKVLAPEFQMQRADGTSFDRAGYLASRLPKVAAIPAFSEMKVTRYDDLLVTRYYVTVEETRDGGTVERYAPRLTVFRKDGDKWLVVAHGNFAALEK